MARTDAGAAPELEPGTAVWLTSADGLAAVTRATHHLDEGGDELSAAADIARSVHDPAWRAAALTAAVARRRARTRWPEADDLLFTREALEQASDPAVSAHRARRLLAGAPRGCPVFDLCAGVGGDAIALAREGRSLRVQVTAVDHDPSRLALLAHNAEVLGVEVAALAADALEVAVPPGALIHADPGRRRGERRMRRLDDYLPSVPALLAAHEGASRWAVALAPGVALDDPLLPGDCEVEYVQVGAALTEANLWRGAPGWRPSSSGRPWSSSDRTGPGRRGPWVARGERDPHRASPAPEVAAGVTEPDRAPGTDPIGPTSSATLLPAGHHLAAEAVHADRLRLTVGPVGDHLVEMAPAAIRARRHDELGAAIGARRLARTRALLTTDEPPPPSPWYRSRAVVAVLPGRARDVKRWLEDRAGGSHGPSSAVEVVLHGVAGDPTDIWRELGRPPRGPQGLRLEFIRRDEDTITVVTRAVASDP